MLQGTNQAWLHLSKYKPHTIHNSLICSDEGLTLETSAFEFLYSSQFTISTQLIKPNFQRCSTTVFLETYPLYLDDIMTFVGTTYVFNILKTSWLFRFPNHDGVLFFTSSVEEFKHLYVFACFDFFPPVQQSPF